MTGLDTWRSKVENGDSEDARVENEIKMLEAKIADLDRKFEQLYDDRFNGILSDRKFQDLSARCEAEQDAARVRRAELVKLQDTLSLSTRIAVRSLVPFSILHTFDFILVSPFTVFIQLSKYQQSRSSQTLP